MQELQQRPPRLLIHGLIGTLRDLVSEFERCGETAFAPDLLGYGALSGVSPHHIELTGQARHLLRLMDEQGLEQVRLVAHSVGGIAAMLLAAQHPERVASLVSVEGNFTLADAFWSAGIARMSEEEVEAVMEGFRTDPAAWLARSGIAPTRGHLAAAERLLADQPAATVGAMARSVIALTAAPDYERLVRSVMEGPVAVHLLAGTESRREWDVPDWASRLAASETLIPGGHLMMVEDAPLFARTVAAVS